MNDPWIDRLVALLSLFLVASSPVVGSLVFQQTADFGQAFGLALVFLIAGILTSFFTRVWEVLNARWAVRFADWLELALAGVFSGYRRQYLNQMTYRCRDFDVEGLNTQGTFALDLDLVFVDLNIAPQDQSRQISEAVSSLPEESGLPLWAYWKTSRGDASPRQLALLGSPGSGKTTLIQHLAFVLAGSRSRRRQYGIPQKLPVLLFLRDLAQTIAKNPDMLLPGLLDSITQKWDLKAPQGWFERECKKGNCLVMFDGLDEIADSKDRMKAAQWIESQMKIYPRNGFIITSRPSGYFQHPIMGLDVFRVLPFNQEQIRHFIQNWYLANEIKRHRKNDEGVRIKARDSANQLIQRLQNDPALMELAANPLLLTMLTTVHRYRSTLPGRRVELYREICEVSLGKRQAAKGLEEDLTPAQKQAVLAPLAFALMSAKEREMTRDCILPVLHQELQSIQPPCPAGVFIEMIQNSSNLLVERENGEIGFSHLTFQEYLASVHVLDHRLEEVLVAQVDDLWWHETIRLYAAQTDASSLLRSILDRGTPSLSVLMLLMEVKNEARSLAPEIRAQLEQVIAAGVEEA